MRTALDSWVLARLLTGADVNGEADAVSADCRPLVDFLGRARVPEDLTGPDRREALAAVRGPLWEAMKVARPRLAELDAEIDATDPEGPPPEVEVEPPERPATLASLRKVMSDVAWHWEGYIPAARILGIGAYEGVGKTRFAMDLARRIYLGLPWPDGQDPTFPAGTPTLWVCADGQQDDLAAIATAMGLPDEALFFNTPEDEPYGGSELDKPEDRERLERFIGLVRPALVFIDTLTNATSYDLCRATENKAMMAPLRDIAQQTQTSIVPLLHLSREGHALGRRIKGVTRTILQLDCPDPDEPSRLKLWVSKSFAKKPPALGVTMRDGGNDYDFHPPSPPEPARIGRTPDQREKAAAFVRDALRLKNDRIGNELAEEFAKSGGCKKTLWRAVDAMEQAGELARDGGKGTGRQVVLHLIANPADSPDTMF